MSGKMIRSVIVMLIASVILAGCVSNATRQEYRWRNASSSLNNEAQWRKDNFECEGIAARTYPTANVTTRLGGGTANCIRVDMFTNCTSDPGFTVTDDTNGAARNRYFMNCLASRGWERYTTDTTQNYSRRDGGHGVASSTSPHESQKYIVETGGYCNESDDCIIGLSCSNHKCIGGGNTPSVPKRCESLSDCPGNRSVCVDNVCVSYVGVDEPCER